MVQEVAGSIPVFHPQKGEGERMKGMRGNTKEREMMVKVKQLVQTLYTKTII